MSKSIRGIFGLAALFLFSFGSSTVAAESPSPSNPCALLPKASQLVSSLRRVAFQKKVECRLLSQSELNSLSASMMRREVNPERLHGEGIFYHLLAIIPPSYKYEDEISALYSQNSVGFYDSGSKVLALLNSSSGAEVLDTMVHELEHALQDQQFNLTRFRDQNLSSDELLARSAVAEGDALILEKEAAQRSDFQALKASVQEGQAKPLAEAGPPLKIPLVLQKLLYFSYEFGPRFLLSSFGSPRPFSPKPYFDKPPRSSSEILHPDRYPTSLNEISLDSSQLIALGYRRIFSDRIGEIALRSYLASSLEQKAAEAAAATWISDRAEIFTPSEPGSPLLIWDIQFRAEEAASKENSVLVLALQKVLELRVSRPSESMPKLRSLQHKNGCLRLVLSEEEHLPSSLHDLIVPQCRSK